MRAQIIAVRALPALATVFAGAVTAQTADFADTATQEAEGTILVVLAHPDDELVIAPAIAAAARKGARVSVLYATSGDAGPGVSDFEPGEALGRARRAEAECAGKALGARIRFLDDIADGTLTDRPRAHGSPAERFADQFSAVLHAARPDTVITWGPDGGYGHGDHRMVSALVTQHLQSLSADTRPALLYPTLVNAPLPPQLAAQGWSLTSPDLAPVSHRYEDTDLTAAGKAAQCHATQFDEATRAMIAPGFHGAAWKGEVRFRKGL
ncbi:PIG-L family deacetylase [Erythrobacter sp.]|jgi:LmbE family N-acetylglucosaminyl deacetylase|uniref:PIG-L family deacetylase n=1 Tax=Erythrobacter sp. TaxID=1042 RepID=UPI002EB9AD21|nr:PIG-L family deacetylase [Erythrobacter sp.]